MEIILSLIICFLAVYGIFRLMYSLTYIFCDTKKTKPETTHQFAIVNDNTIFIEEYVRDLAIKNETDGLVLLDNTKTDEMKKLLQIINSEFDFVSVTNYNEYTNYLKSKLD